MISFWLLVILISHSNNQQFDLSNVLFLVSDKGFSNIFSCFIVLFNCSQNIFFAKFGANFVLKCAAKNWKSVDN